MCARKEGYSPDKELYYYCGMIHVYWASVLFSGDVLRLYIMLVYIECTLYLA